MNIHDPHNSRALARLMNKVRAGHGDRWLQFMKDAHELPDMEAIIRRAIESDVMLLRQKEQR